MLNDVLQKKTSPKLADRTSAINALITETTNELFQSQVAICNCLNQLANLKSKNVQKPLTIQSFDNLERY